MPLATIKIMGLWKISWGCVICVNFIFNKDHPEEMDGRPGAQGFTDPRQKSPTSPRIPFQNEAKLFGSDLFDDDITAPVPA